MRDYSKAGSGNRNRSNGTDEAENISEATEVAVKKEIEYKPLETKTNVDPHYVHC